MIGRSHVEEGSWEEDSAKRITVVLPKVQCKVQNTHETVAESLAKPTCHTGVKEWMALIWIEKSLRLEEIEKGCLVLYWEG